MKSETVNTKACEKIRRRSRQPLRGHKRLNQRERERERERETQSQQILTFHSHQQHIRLRLMNSEKIQGNKRENQANRMRKRGEGWDSGRGGETGNGGCGGGKVGVEIETKRKGTYRGFPSMIYRRDTPFWSGTLNIHRHNTSVHMDQKQKWSQQLTVGDLHAR